MEGLQIYNKAHASALINLRDGEIKLGEQVCFVENLDQLTSSNAKFVLLGIPEDIGVRANQGISGTATAWQPALKALLNIQSNRFLEGGELLLLGHFAFTESPGASLEQLQQKVAGIDEAVFPVIQKIVMAGKIPIVIGGGHNNAYPIIKGCSLGLNTPIDVINLDAHADLRPSNGRHSGNGFSYALEAGYLNHYGVFGLQENYNNEEILKRISQDQRIHSVFFDDLLKSEQPVSHAWKALLQLSGPDTGLELDLDCLANLLSSASGPSGFSLNEVRQLILNAAIKFQYLHICEGAVALSDGRRDQSTAKTIACLISDFIKSQSKLNTKAS